MAEASISKEECEFLQQRKMTTEEMAGFFDVSTSTVKRHLQKFGIRKVDRNREVSDSELDSCLLDIVHQNPAWGEVMLRGSLINRGFNVSRKRLRESMHRIDPEGVRLRRKNALHRRQYQVDGPNSLWHVDGNEKLKRWGFYILGCIDGYSRLPTFLQLSTNKKSCRVLDLFVAAIMVYGLPRRLRMDAGTENVLIADLMLLHPERGPHRNSVLVGRSVHNQRIERFWRDVNNSTLIFYNLFSSFESELILDLESEEDKFSLKYVYFPVIEFHILQFEKTWSFHKIRTEGKSPLELWESVPVEMVDELVVNEISDVLKEDLNDDEPEQCNPLSDEAFEELKGRFPTVCELSGDYLRGMYEEVRHFVREKVGLI